MKKYLIIIVIIAISILIFAEDDNPVYLIKNGKIMPIIGDVIEGGDVLIKDGKILEVGKGIIAPSEAIIIDASGMFVYPGFIDGYSHFGLMEIGAIASTVDFREMGKENPEVKVAWAINPHSVHFGTSRITGTTTALVAPEGGTFPGLSAIIKMDGWTFPEMMVKEVATSFINFPMSPPQTRGARLGSQQTSKVDVTAKLVEKIKEYLEEARRYLTLKSLGENDSSITPPEFNPKFEALAPVLNGTLPVIISVEKAKDIELAIKFIKEENLKAIFRSCNQGFKVAEKIKESGIPVIIGSLYRGPTEYEDGYDAAYRNVVELAKAGVLICFSSGYDPSLGKDLPYHASKAVAFGLPHEDALKALTINPAKIFGLDDRLGSLETGKDADVIICDGDPLDIRTEVKIMLINGKKVDLQNWWKDLYDKWKARPLK